MKKIEFTPPEGFVLPEGSQPGDRLEFMCEVEVQKGGKLCLASLDGEDLPGYGPGEKDEEGEESFGSRVRRYMKDGPDEPGAPPPTAGAASVVNNLG